MESLELKPIFYVIFGIVITIVVGLVLWNKFAPDASRAFYNTVTGPGGLFGLALAGRRKKGMEMSLLVLIIGSVIAITVIFLVMGGFIGESGGVSSSLRDSLTDFGLGALSNIG